LSVSSLGPRALTTWTMNGSDDGPLPERFPCIWRHQKRGCDQRVYILEEIVETEENYVTDLDICIGVSVYLHPFGDSDAPGLTK
jgi:hypothetical protein